MDSSSSDAKEFGLLSMTNDMLFRTPTMCSYSPWSIVGSGVNLPFGTDGRETGGLRLLVGTTNVSGAAFCRIGMPRLATASTAAFALVSFRSRASRTCWGAPRL